MITSLPYPSAPHLQRNHQRAPVLEPPLSTFTYQTSSKSKAFQWRSIIPKDSIDSHIHIVLPDHYPLSPSRAYTPTPASIKQAQDTLGSTFQRFVIVQPSIYDTDNRCTIDSTRTLSAMNGCASIAVVDMTLDQITQLKEVDPSIRALRINMASTRTNVDSDSLHSQLKASAPLLNKKGWALQLHLEMHSLPAIKTALNAFDVPIVFDHFARPSCLWPQPYDLNAQNGPEGLQDLIELLSNQSKQVYVKLSAPYRFLPKHANLDLVFPLFRLLVNTAPDRLVIGSDWPHTRYEDFDAQTWLELVTRWSFALGGHDLVRKIFVTNAEKLWGVSTKHLSG